MERGTEVRIVKIDEILENPAKKLMVLYSENKLITFNQTENVLVSEQTVLDGHCLCLCHVCLTT